MNTADKLAALRSQFAGLGIDGLIVPGTDEFLGEHVPPSAERIVWLTGFTGSNGISLVLADDAVVMSDARYSEQLTMEVDPSVFAIADRTEMPPAQWLLARVKADARIGYDPRLHAAAEVEGLAAKGLTLVALADNPIDALWHDRPAAPAGALRIFPEGIAGRSVAEKTALAGAAIAKAGGFAMLIAVPESAAWLLNIRGDDVPHTPVALSYVLAWPDGRVEWFIAPARVDAAVRRHLGDRVAVTDPARLAARLRAVAGQAAAAKLPVLLDEARTPVWFKTLLAGAGAATANLEDPCLLPRACKTAEEQESIRAAHVTDGVAMARFLCWLDAAGGSGDLTELAIVAKAQEFRAMAPDYRGDSFDAIAGWGPHGAIVHYRPAEKTNARIVPPGLLLFDSGGQYAGGTTDITRTVAIGEPLAEVRENFTLVLKGHIAVAMARFPEGTNGIQVDAFARQALWMAGRDYDHGTGHGVGCYLSVHEEAASFSKRPGRAVMPGMLISNEPGFYKVGAYGIRIESLVLVREDGVREGTAKQMLALDTVTLAPHDRRLIETGLLTPVEIAWLDAYHARVLAVLAPLVEPDVAAWLRAACAPLSVIK